jgi:hypothetical protein
MKHYSALMSCLAIPLLWSQLSFASPDSREIGTKSAFRKIADSALIANGDASVGTYNVKTLNIGREVNELKAYYRDNHSECGTFTITVGRQEAIKTIASRDIGDPSTASSLKSLVARGKIKTIISAIWDRSEGEAEDCLMSSFQAYSTDGYRLDLLYSFID